MNEKTLWNAGAGLAAVGAAMAGRKAANAIWKKSSSIDPPVNPADRSIDWKVALLWAVFAGVLAGVSRMIGRRGAAAAYEAAFGQAPPGIST